MLHRLATIEDSAADLSPWQANPQDKLNRLVDAAIRREWAYNGWDKAEHGFKESRDLGSLPSPSLLPHVSPSSLLPHPSPSSLLPSGESLTPTFLVLLVDGWCPRIVPFEKVRIRQAIWEYYTKLFASFSSFKYQVIVSALSKYAQTLPQPFYWDHSTIRPNTGDRSRSPGLIPEKLYRSIFVAAPARSTWLSETGYKPGPSFRYFKQLETTQYLEAMNFTEDLDIREHTQKKRLDTMASTFPTVLLNEHNLVISSTALFAAVDWLKDQGSFFNLDFDGKSRLRNAFIAQMCEVSQLQARN